jgi:hypothetical protein
MEPATGYALDWALWLSQVPYGIWSERIAHPSMREFRHTAARLETDSIRPALDRFGVEVRPPWTELDLATAMSSLVEGAWLNHCLSTEHPTRPDSDATRALRDGLWMLWQGATQPAGGDR